MKQTSQKMLKFRHTKVKSTYLVVSLNYKMGKIVWKNPTAFEEVKNKQKWYF